LASGVNDNEMNLGHQAFSFAARLNTSNLAKSVVTS
jgi:hypothetical protein